MTDKASDRAKLRAAYSHLRKRLLAERKLEEARMVQARQALDRINHELAALERDQRQLELGSRSRRSTLNR